MLYPRAMSPWSLLFQLYGGSSVVGRVTKKRACALTKTWSTQSDPGTASRSERGGTPGRVPGTLVSWSLMHSFVRKMCLSEPIVNSPVQEVMARRIGVTDDKTAIQTRSFLAECYIRMCCICDPGVIWLIDEYKYRYKLNNYLACRPFAC